MFLIISSGIKVVSGWEIWSFNFSDSWVLKLEIKDSNVGACLNGVSQWLAWCMIVRSGKPRAPDFFQIKLQTKLHKKIVHEPLFGLLSPTHLWVCSCLQHRRSAVQFNMSLILAGYQASHLRCLNRVLFLSPISYSSSTPPA